MLWIRGLTFTILVPVVVGFVLPSYIADGGTLPGGIWSVGWVLVVLGALGYALCLFRFLSAGGTPAIFFSRPIRFLIGEEPPGLVSGGLYQVTRNPMYVSALFMVFGQAVIHASTRVAIYGLIVFLCCHAGVVLLEEPHLRRTRGPSYVDYCRRVPRWLGFPR